MKHEKHVLHTLTADDGMQLTNGKDIGDAVDFWDDNDSPDNWREITDAEAEELQKVEEMEV